MNQGSTCAALALLGALAPSAAAAPADIEIIYVNTPGAPANVVPGVGGEFNAGSGTTNFVRPWFSRDGNHWAIEALLEAPATTADDNIYIVDGALFLRENSSQPWLSAGEFVGTLDDLIAINNNGEVLITNNSTSTTNDDYVVFFDSLGTPTLLAQEAGMVDAILTDPSVVGATWDDDMDGPVLTDSGTPGWQADGVDGGMVTTANDDFSLLGSAILARKGDTPMMQLVAPDANWENFDVEDWFINTDGSVVVIDGDMDGATASDQIITRNGVVVLQENVVIPGSSFTDPIDTTGIVQVWMDPAGNWYARGNNDVTEQDWVVRNGVVVETADALQEIVPGSGEHWVDDASFTDCFFAMDGNASGAYVIGGITDAAATANGVLVLVDGANRSVVVRENDPVDVDGNGMFDDDRFINTIGNDDVRLLPDGTVVFTATLRTGAGTAVDQGLFRVRPEGFNSFCFGDGGDQLGCTNCPCGNNAAMGSGGGCLNSNASSARLVGSGTPDVTTPADTLHFDVIGANVSTFGILASGSVQLPNNPANICFTQNPGSGVQSAALDGLRCVGGTFLRHGSRSSDVNGDIGITTNGWGPPNNPLTGLGVSNGFIAGQTRYFQVFYREDALSVCMTGQNTTQAVEVTFF